MACTLTATDHADFLAVHPREFVARRWKGKDAGLRAPNILRMISTFNKRLPT